MSPRARLSDTGAEVFAPVAALGLTTGAAPARMTPANDTGASERLDLLVQRRRRQNRREHRS
jgi:hypothetical protein